MTGRRIPIAGPWITDRELAYVADAVRNAWYANANVFHDRFERSFAEDDLCAYVRTPEPYDKAGAYAIQGHAALWCAGIEGCYYNIMGLPVHRTAQLLREFT